MLSPELTAFADYASLQAEAAELIRTGRTLNFKGTGYDEGSKKISRRLKSPYDLHGRYSDAYTFITATANKWRPEVTRGISDDYKAQMVFAHEVVHSANEAVKRISRQNRAPINPPLNPKI
jgi:hypothetical protein